MSASIGALEKGTTSTADILVDAKDVLLLGTGDSLRAFVTVFIEQ
jgi:hypothetical protein